MIKTVKDNLNGFKLVSLLTPLAMILEVIMEMIIPRYMASIVDDGVAKGDMAHIYRMGIMMFVMALIGLFAGIAGGAFGARASAGLAKNLRKSMYDRIQTFSFSNIDKFSSAGLVTRLTTDVTNVQNAYQMLLRMGTRAPFSLIFAMIMAFTINAKISLIYLGAVILLSIFIAFIMSRATKYFKQTFEKYDELNASVEENVSAIRVVKAFVREDYENDKFTKATKNLYNMFMNAEKTIITNMPVMSATVYTSILLISWIGAKMIVAGDLSTGNLMNLLTYCMNILMSLMMLSMIFVMITMSSASLNRISEVLREETDIKNSEAPIYEVRNGEIEFKSVSFSYNKNGEKPVLNNINLKINSGETIGIIGGTGSSKTSLVNLISRLYDVSEGSVMVGGADVKNYDLETLRDKVSVVLQKNVLFSGTILENLRWGDENASLEDCKRVCRMACADEFIEKLPDKYDTFIEQGGSNVSGGQRQRLCIARALLKKPKVLILDDSTSAVDTATDAKIRRAFAEEIPDTTKLIIAQRVSSIQSADRIIVMDDGEVVGFGTHEELLSGNEIYRDVYESQTGGSGDFDENGGAQ
ncbi:MAG: ABC transporter ATP-binding protein [Lachnospiraceae bacterium]|nr:ABC transporter ATP-binding protein [Lachnospiraceae bacterium]